MTITEVKEAIANSNLSALSKESRWALLNQISLAEQALSKIENILANTGNSPLRFLFLEMYADTKAVNVFIQ